MRLLVCAESHSAVQRVLYRSKTNFVAKLERSLVNRAALFRNARLSHRKGSPMPFSTQNRCSVMLSTPHTRTNSPRSTADPWKKAQTPQHLNCACLLFSFLSCRGVSPQVLALFPRLANSLVFRRLVDRAAVEFSPYFSWVLLFKCQSSLNK